MAAMVGLYLTDPLEYDLELVLSRGEAKTACPRSAALVPLGLDTWSFSGDMLSEVGLPSLHNPFRRLRR